MNEFLRAGSIRRFWLLSGLLALSVVCVGWATTVAAGTRPRQSLPGAVSAATQAVAESSAPASNDKPAEQSKAAETNSAAKKAESAAESAEESQAASKEAEQKSEPAEAKAKEAADQKQAKSEQAEPKRVKVRLAELVLKDELPESLGQIGPFGQMQLDLREVILRIEKAAEDKKIAGMVLKIRNPAIGRGKIDELRGAIKRFRASGKKMYAQLELALPADYMIACACDEIVMPESGIVLLPGIHAEATFYKGLLGKLGIQADFIHMGAYKGAAEPLTREKFSEPVRENMTTLIDGLYDQLVTTIVKDRPLTVAQVKDIIDKGLLPATQAKELGLVDRIAYPDTLRAELAETYDADPLVYVQNYGQKEVDTDFSGPMGFVKLMQTIMGDGGKAKKSRDKKIAVVYALGAITTGKSQQDSLVGNIMGSDTIVQALREAADDENVVAIVLRIDSPGGSALASDLIWRQTQVIEKPIVASMSDVAASGGYYIAMGADKIVAAPGTITGSIGVVGGKFAITGLYDKIGISTETIQRGQNSGMFGSSGKFTESERAVFLEFMEDTYRQFTSKAAEGRHMPREELLKLAGGRVYTGLEAKNNGLVDELGTLHDAVQEAKQLAGLDTDTKVEIEVLPEPVDFFEILFGMQDKEKEVSLGLRLEQVAPELVEAARRAYRLRAVFEQPAALIMPFDLDIR